MKNNELVHACVKGDRKAQKLMYDTYAGKMMAISKRYSKSIQEAEDILQESFLKVFNNLKKLREDSNLEAWIKKIVINTAINHHRNKLYLYPMVDIGYLRKGYDESTALSSFHVEELMAFIQELPLGCQVIFNLYAIEGYSHKEIASMLNLSEGTSKSQYARAKLLLQNKLQEESKKSYEKLNGRIL